MRFDRQVKGGGFYQRCSSNGCKGAHWNRLCYVYADGQLRAICRMSVLG